jgi:hypothetical protein
MIMKYSTIRWKSQSKSRNNRILNIRIFKSRSGIHSIKCVARSFNDRKKRMVSWGSKIELKNNYYYYIMCETMFVIVD